jgi:hypothetical protein
VGLYQSVNTSELKRRVSCFGLVVIAGFVLSACAPVNSQNVPILADDETTEGHEVVSQSVRALGQRILGMGFAEPKYTKAEEDSILAKYAYLDPSRQVPSNLLKKTVLYYHANLAKIENKNYITIVDFSKFSGKKRFFLVNTATGAVKGYRVAHGSGSDQNNDGYPERFSNIEGSLASSVGYFLTAETYFGKYNRSLRIDGLSTTNSNVRDRAVVIHGSDYVQDANVQQGRSWGCFALPMGQKEAVIDMLRNGSLIFAGLSGKK